MPGDTLPPAKRAPAALERGSQKAFRAFQEARRADIDDRKSDELRSFEEAAADLDRTLAVLDHARTARVDGRTRGNFQWHRVSAGRMQVTFKTPEAKERFVAEYEASAERLFSEVLFLCAPPR